MSFQDLSRRGSSNGGVTSGGPSNAPRRSNGAPPPRGLDGAVDAIAENLRQFSHNVSLLERLADHLAGAPRASEELLRQIAAQQDVVEELARVLRKAFGDLVRRVDAAPRAEQGRARAAHAKLRKDFDRVQGTVGRAVDKIKSSRRAALGAGGAAAAAAPRAGGGGAAVDHRDLRVAVNDRPSSSSGGPHRVGRAQFGPSDAPGDLDVMIGEERVQLQVAMQEEAINDAILREREEEIREINQNVHKVNEIFRDLATLVDKQQGEVDQIGELVEKSHAHAEKGLDQVQKAAKLQPSCVVS
ncbi:hypothetical protein AURANDRAFT_71610 [Aureococcus anophagefferens]|uniref:t-SNARE coiled-coil homology domain-containing protein n=1 Tax=Aureococcus anophagefferens TaxID=44056 RepID=F0Y8W0_AURAN|nr:hypothetical protein AURANDRAFT_71610 [Aureococcus anophagefferens]EGB08451.1 hypothetical protein AURANDRAFT_71610 [Aureococcus anophagefferens]|eukprot:XP_009037166.1 hypothetical protein AURANDRAFT_71610 [Aureococcus anophagefferens]